MFIEEIDATSEDFFDDSLALNHQDYFYQSSYSNNTEYSYDYSIDDCVLVRTTEFFPFGGKITSPENGFGIIEDLPIGFDNILFDMFKKLDVSDEEKKRIKNLLCLKHRVRRNTVHFTINGLVGSHLYGSFDDRPFKIIEPLKYHIDSKQLKALRVEDTYFEGDVQLSDDAVLIIKSEVYEKIKDDPLYAEDLKRYKIFTYKGNNEKKAVGEVLNKLGYDSFLVSSHGYSDGLESKKPAGKMYQFINEYAQTASIDQSAHFDSELNIMAHNKMYMERLELSKELIRRMTKKLNKSEKETEFFINNLEASYIERNKYYVDLITEYGIENLIELVSQINQETLSKIQEEIEEKNIKKVI